MQSTLGSFQETQSTDAFALQNSKLLKVSLDQITIQARLGSMVAYQGDVRFEHAGSGGLNKFIKKAVTGEGTKLMKIEGTGEGFLAHLAEDIHLIKLENDQITCNGENVLAFDAGIEWDIKRLEGAGAVSGALAGGLYNMALSGSGWGAIRSDGAARAAADHSGDANLLRPAGRDHVVEQPADAPEDRREHEVPDREGLGRVA